DLETHIDARIDQGLFWPAAACIGETIDELEVARCISIALLLAQRGFSQKIHRKADACSVKRFENLRCFLDRASGNESPRELHDVLLDRNRPEPSGRPARGCSKSSCQRRRKLPPLPQNVLPHVKSDLVARLENRKNVNESKEIHLERWLAHRPLEETPLPVAL